MREYGFTIEYEPGIDPITDVFIEHPSAIASALSITVSVEGLWRVDRIAGPTEALSALEAVFLDSTHCNECAGPHAGCSADRNYEVLSRDPSAMTVYSRLRKVQDCHSVPYLATTRLGTGLVFDAQRRGNRYSWRLLLPEDRQVGSLFDAMQTGLPDGISIAVEHVGDPARWGELRTTIADLPFEQREVLETAVRRGYYEQPRGLTLSELAEAVGTPTSTCRYRLRRAEEWLINEFVQGESMIGASEKPESAVLPGSE